MKTSMNWLREYVDIPLSNEAYMHAMIRTGTEIEGVEPLSGGMDKVVVGRVLSCVRHENSDHLSVCQVDVGSGDPLQIVCGAPNVKAGILVPVAVAGATLPGGHQIREGKLRGVLSQGMLCSATELKVPQELYPSVGDEGLLIFQEDYPLGEEVSSILGLDDAVVDAEILANRPDLLSVWGLARETAAVLDKPFRMPKTGFEELPGSISDEVSIRVEDADLCPRYTTRVIKDVRIGPSPLWLRSYLHAAGMRAINNIVDITNFVMLETGHPMHAFDLKEVRGKEIIVRRAKAGELLTTLDGKEHSLSGGELLICDREGPTGLAGIMGGLESEITEGTRDILFECASFDRSHTRITARALGIRTESSSRFERGVSPATVMQALDRACHLVEALEAGKVLAGCIDLYPSPVAHQPIEASVRRINALTGVPMAGEEMLALLQRLHFEAELAGDRLTVTAPDFRQDIEQEADICEEVLRMGGYERIPSTRLRGETTQGADSLSRRRQSRLSSLLMGLGYDEIMNYSFFSQKQLDSLRLPADDPRLQALRILNPLGEDSALMRTSLMPDMLKVLALNMNHGNAEARLYEFGRVFDPVQRTKEGLPTERPRLSLGCYGEGQDFYSIRDAVLSLFTREGIGYDIRRHQEPYLHPGRSACILHDEKTLAVVGEVHPSIMEDYGMNGRAFLADVDLEAVCAAASPLQSVQDLPRMPAVSRDIALVMDEAQELLPLQRAIERACGPLLEKVELFDVYRGAQLGEGKKSAAFALTLRAADRSLEEKEIQAVVDKVQRSVKAQFGAELRS